MREAYDAFRQRRAEILVIGPEGPRRFKQVWDEQQYPFVGFADYKHTVADLYGQQVKLLKLGRMPAMLVVDRQGIIQFTHFGDDMADIPKNDQVLALLDRLNRLAETQDT
ncbi:MAG TPA: redoxin domain-containing protein [Chloroflexi bacterium]|nr:redoxin domain-containing protein [Chloroflexota bacterium]